MRACRYSTKRMPAPSLHDRFKWTLLARAPDIHNSGIAYFLAKEAWPEKGIREHDALVQTALLELLDEGLIFFYWGDWDEGCTLDPATAVRASRAEVEADLARGGDAPPTEQSVWFTVTPEGQSRLATISRGALLR